MEVKFYDHVPDCEIRFAVVLARSNGKWVFCRHKDRDTYEIPGGHREPGESVFAAAKRELHEETGAVDYELSPVCVYSVTGKNRVNETGEKLFGMLFYADVFKFENQLHFEMEQVVLLDDIPAELTYPEIQPKLIEHAILLGCNEECNA